MEVLWDVLNNPFVTTKVDRPEEAFALATIPNRGNKCICNQLLNIALEVEVLWDVLNNPFVTTKVDRPEEAFALAINSLQLHTQFFLRCTLLQV